MDAQTTIKTQLSNQYFEKCSQLHVIEEPFALKNIQEEIQRRDIQTQFELLRALTQTKKHKTLLRINSIIQNKKNRYPEQSIYQHSRIVLSSNQSQDSTYINANYIPLKQQKKIIVTQGPLQSTQNDFEQMIRQEKIQCVVMLCNPIQNGKVRCFDYCDNRQTQNVQQYGDYLTVTKVYIEGSQENEEKYQYCHLHYSQWPDRGLPKEHKHIQQVILQCLKYNRIVIHCSAGLGRSGVLTSILLLSFQQNPFRKISIFGTVRSLREHRYGSIQNNEQYRYIYNYFNTINKQHKQQE